jgi:DNA polymerase-3 subunit alpha
MYTSLHAHSSIGSIRDSILRIDDYVAKAKSFGMESLGLSDHGNLAGNYKFYKSCKKAGIKPVLGFESYFVLDHEAKDKIFHLGLIAKNNVGLQNLYKISSSAYINYFYKKPRVTKELLFNNSEGIIVTSACLAGPFQQLFLAGNRDAAVNEIKDFIRHFGDDFYLEIHNHGIPEEEPIRNFFTDVGTDLKCKIVGGVDSHYLNNDDKPTHNIFKQLAYGSVGKANDDGFEGTGYHFFSPDEYFRLFGKELADNTMEISDKCKVSISHHEYHLPKFDTGGIDKFEYIKQKSFEGLKKFGKDTDKQYIDRLNYELGIIHMGRLEDYFLIVSDTSIWCKENDVAIGPGRGSSAGSLLCYCLGITQIDPIPYGLMFGRMLNAGRLMQYDFGV